DHFLGDIKPKTSAAFALFGREIRIENLAHLGRLDTGTAILDPDIDIKIFARAVDGHRTLFLRGGLDSVDDHVLNGAIDLDGVTHQRAFVLADLCLQFEAVLGGSGTRGLDDLAQ